MPSLRMLMIYASAPFGCAFSPSISFITPRATDATGAAYGCMVQPSVLTLAVPLLHRPSPRGSSLRMSEKGVGELLREYGVVALGFHFSVWLSSVVLVYSVLSVAGADLLSMLPGNIEAGASMGKLAATVGIVEAIGPARIALTIAATPTVSKMARGVPVVRLTIRRADVLATNVVENITGRFSQGP
uniref:DUF1279 domain-containing protein n=1 Tax=Coccolithus braarudii TaxID=221442 RepID=A0A7S0QAA0_9EUKA|mmetsp:Transcript_52013/g.111217  ORF Transcript_52013/g.111217 Transcript_52013/m.111217 type:complete len:187 (+) Transcript_52013:52-612(+)